VNDRQEQQGPVPREAAGPGHPWWRLWGGGAQ
jgi:hypothetical protein